MLMLLPALFIVGYDLSFTTELGKFKNISPKSKIAAFQKQNSLQSVFYLAFLFDHLLKNIKNKKFHSFVL